MAGADVRKNPVRASAASGVTRMDPRFFLTRFRNRISRAPALSTNSICASRAGPTLPVSWRSPRKITDRLGDEIAELAAHLDAATARLLEMIREFDARGGWNHGFRSCAHWLSYRAGMKLGAGREHVRVARALASLPRLADALAHGELSYSKVRALTRVATPETEERLLAVGKAGTACHVERIVRGWRRVDRMAEAQETARLHKARALHVYQTKTVWS